MFIDHCIVLKYCHLGAVRTDIIPMEQLRNPRESKVWVGAAWPELGEATSQTSVQCSTVSFISSYFFTFQVIPLMFFRTS